MKKTILAGIAGAAIAGAIGFAAPSQAAPCSYFGDDPKADYSGICGAPDLADSILNAGTNLQTNFSPTEAGKNLQKNLDSGSAASNLQHNLTNGVGTDDPPA
jgi:hypothetical protein